MSCCSASGAKGAAKPKGAAVASHNNEKDYLRRQGVWAQIKADEQADLEALVRRHTYSFLTSLVKGFLSQPHNCSMLPMINTKDAKSHARMDVND